jgi:hypothetical protein
LWCRAPRQWKIPEAVQATNFIASISFSVDLKKCSKQQFRRKLFDCKENGIRGMWETLVLNCRAHVFGPPAGKKLGLNTEIEDIAIGYPHLRGSPHVQ